MNIQERVSGVGTSAGPGFCLLNNTSPCLAWKGEGTDPGLYFSKAANLTENPSGQYAWEAQEKVPNVASSDGPAIAGFDSTVFMAWKGEGTDKSLYFSKLANTTATPQVWAAQTKLALGSTNAPALAATGEAGLFIACKGESDNSIWWSKTTDGKTWAKQEQIVFGKTAAETSSSPALAAFGSTVYLAWKGGSDNSIWWSKCSDGKTWSAQQRVTFGTNTGPAIVADSNGVVWLAWKAVHTDAIYYCSLTNESQNKWSPQVVRYGVGTSDRPALMAGGNGSAGIAMAWKGENTDPGIYYGPLLLPVASSLTFVLPRQNIGQGSSSSFAIQAQLVMNQNGSCTFSGTFFCENSPWPGNEDYMIAFAIKDGDGHAYTFTHSGSSSGTDPWNLTSTNIGVTQNWAGIVINNPTPTNSNSFFWKASDSYGIGDFFNGILSDLEAAGVEIEKIITVVGQALGKVGEATSEASAAAGE